MFRLLTYNILHGGRGRSLPIAAVINSCAPDLVLVQEATDPATLERIAEAAGMAEWRSYPRQSLGFLSRHPVVLSKWTKPRFSQHAFIEVVPAGEELRVFGVHLSAVHAAWTERRRVMELRALLRAVVEHQHGFHVLTGDFNTVAPDRAAGSDAVAAAAPFAGVVERWAHPLAHDPDRARRRLRGRLPVEARRRAGVHAARRRSSHPVGLCLRPTRPRGPRRGLRRGAAPRRRSRVRSSSGRRRLADGGRHAVDH